jgi:hypothetical protein
MAHTGVAGGYRPNARVALVEADGQIEAFWPFELAPLLPHHYAGTLEN